MQAASATSSMLVPYSMHLLLATQAEASLHTTYTHATRQRQRSPITIARTTNAIIRAQPMVITSDKNTFGPIRLVLAVCSLTWVIEFKSMVHVIPILLHRQWTVVRRVGEADAHVLCRYVVCRQRNMQPLSQSDLPQYLATCRRQQGGGECPP